MEVYKADIQKPVFTIHDEDQLNRIRAVPDDMKEILLDADFAISLTMADLPDNDASKLEKTGLKW